MKLLRFDTYVFGATSKSGILLLELKYVECTQSTKWKGKKMKRQRAWSIPKVNIKIVHTFLVRYFKLTKKLKIKETKVEMRITNLDEFGWLSHRMPRPEVVSKQFISYKIIENWSIHKLIK